MSLLENTKNDNPEEKIKVKSFSKISLITVPLTVAAGFLVGALLCSFVNVFIFGN